MGSRGDAVVRPTDPDDGLVVERLAAGDELAYSRAVVRHFHEDLTDDEAGRWVPMVAADDHRGWVARDPGGRIVGNLGVLTTRLHLPGGSSVPVAGVTAVGVSQTHRRRGLLRRLMVGCLDEAVDAGEPVAALYASEGAIYGRFGFGASGPQVRYRIDRARARFRDPVDPRLVVDIDPEDATTAFPHILERIGEVRATITSTPDRWRVSVLEDPPDARGGASARRLVHVPDRGYATYRIAGADGDGLPSGTVQVESLVALDAEADAALWQHVCDIDLTETIVADVRAPDDVLPALLVDPGQAQVRVSDPVYTRLLDLPRALASRGYASTGDVVLDVDDPLGYAHGRYRLEVTADGPTCEPVGTAPAGGPGDRGADLHLPIDALSAVWLGGERTTRLVAARRVTELRAGAAADLDRLLWVDRAPWTPFVF